MPKQVLSMNGRLADRFLIAEACINSAEECRDEATFPGAGAVCRSADVTACASLALAVGLERATVATFCRRLPHLRTATPFRVGLLKH